MANLPAVLSNSSQQLLGIGFSGSDSRQARNISEQRLRLQAQETHATLGVRRAELNRLKTMNKQQQQQYLHNVMVYKEQLKTEKLTREEKEIKLADMKRDEVRRIRFEQGEEARYKTFATTKLQLIKDLSKGNPAVALAEAEAFRAIRMPTESMGGTRAKTEEEIIAKAKQVSNFNKYMDPQLTAAIEAQYVHLMMQNAPGFHRVGNEVRVGEYTPAEGEDKDAYKLHRVNWTTVLDAGASNPEVALAVLDQTRWGKSELVRAMKYAEYHEVPRANGAVERILLNAEEKHVLDTAAKGDITSFMAIQEGFRASSEYAASKNLLANDVQKMWYREYANHRKDHDAATAKIMADSSFAKIEENAQIANKVVEYTDKIKLSRGLDTNAVPEPGTDLYIDHAQAAADANTLVRNELRSASTTMISLSQKVSNLTIMDEEIETERSEIASKSVAELADGVLIGGRYFQKETVAKDSLLTNPLVVKGIEKSTEELLRSISIKRNNGMISPNNEADVSLFRTEKKVKAFLSLKDSTPGAEPASTKIAPAGSFAPGSPAMNIDLGLTAEEQKEVHGWHKKYHSLKNGRLRDPSPEAINGYVSEFEDLRANILGGEYLKNRLQKKLDNRRQLALEIQSLFDLGLGPQTRQQTGQPVPVEQAAPQAGQAGEDNINYKLVPKP